MAKKATQTEEDDKKGLPTWVWIAIIVGSWVLFSVVGVVALLVSVSGDNTPKENDPALVEQEQKNWMTITAVDSSFTNYDEGFQNPWGYKVQVDVVIDAGDITKEPQVLKVDAYKELLKNREGLLRDAVRRVVMEATTQELKSSKLESLETRILDKFTVIMKHDDFTIERVVIPQCNPFPIE